MKEVNFLKIINCFILFVALILVTLASTSGYLVSQAQFNADALQIPAIAQDILKGGSLSDWYLSTAPYYFPDIPLSMLAFLLTLDSFAQIILSGVFQTLITFGAIWYLAAKVSPGRAFSQAVIAITMIIWVALIPAENFYHKAFCSVFSYIFVMAYHYGSFINQLLTVVLWMACFEGATKNRRIILFILLCIVSLFAGASDALFIPQTPTALVVTVAITSFIYKAFSWKKLCLAFIVFAGSILGKYLHNYLNPQAISVGLRESPLYYLEKYLWKNLNSFSEMMIDIMEPAPLYAVFLFCYIIIIFHAIYTAFKKKEFTDSEKNLFFILLFSFLTIIITMVTLTISWLPLSTDRFLLPLFFFPFIITVIYIGYYFKTGMLIFGTMLSSVLLLSLSISLINYAEINGIRNKVYSEFNRCIDQTLEETGGRNGITEYWTARPLQLFTKLDLEIAPYSNLHDTFERFRPNHWVTSKRFFKDSYDFAIISNSSDKSGKSARSRITEYNGEPKREVMCEGALLLVYEKGKLFTDTHPPILHIGKPAKWMACESTIIYNGTSTKNCSVEIKDNKDTKHMLTLYLQLQPPGRYAFKLNYSSPFTQDKVVADWKVEIRAKIDDLLSSGSLYGSDDQIKSITGNFTILPEHIGKTKYPSHEEREVEFAVYVPKDTDFKLESIEITRLE